jgi:hypothetical protein
MRDQAQMLAHVHDAEIEICEGPGQPRPVALDLKAKPTGKPSGNLWCYLTLIAKVGTCFEMAVILHGSEPGTKKEPALCREKEPALLSLTTAK